jgi:hypothetical protein
MQQTLKNESESVDDILEDLVDEGRGASHGGTAEEDGNTGSIPGSSSCDSTTGVYRNVLDIARLNYIY